MMNSKSSSTNKLIFAFMLMVGLMLGLTPMTTLAQSTWQASPEADGYKNPVKADKKSIAAGKKVFDVYCKLCHGDTGKGDGPSGGSLEVKPANLTDKKLMKQSDGSLAWKILTGKGPMPSWAPVLKEDDIWNVINYMRKLNK